MLHCWLIYTCACTLQASLLLPLSHCYHPYYSLMYTGMQLSTGLVCNLLLLSCLKSDCGGFMKFLSVKR